jgi:hypothetical protein
MTRNVRLTTTAVLLLSSAALAQPQPPAGAPGPVVPGAAPADVQLSAPASASLTPQEMVAQAQEHRTRMMETLGRLNALSEAARKDRDIIRLNCLNDKIAQVKANITIAEQSIQALSEAVARGDTSSQLHEFTRVTIVDQKVQLLGGEADACVGADLTFVGRTRVEVQVTGNLPGDEVTQPRAPGYVVERPPPTSPFM